MLKNPWSNRKSSEPWERSFKPAEIATLFGRANPDKWVKTRLGMVGFLLGRPRAQQKNLSRIARRVIAHRTGPGTEVALENKIATGKRSVSAGASIEGDVVRLRDGVLVVHHDLTGERTLGNHRRLSQLSWRDLEQYEKDIPTLDSFLRAFKEVEIVLDVKFDSMASYEANVSLVDSTIQNIRQVGIESQVTLASLESWRGAVLIRSRGYLGPTALSRPELYIMYLAPWLYRRLPLTGDVAQIPLKTAKQLGEKFIESCKNCELRSHVWDVEDGKTAKELFSMGFDFVETDYPHDVLRELGD